MPLDPDEVVRLLEWAAVADEANYYEVLGILPLADEAEIRRAFHDFSLAFHPDCHLDARPPVRAATTRLFRLGVEAYRVLSSPELRAHYDLDLARGVLRLGGDTRGSGPAAQSLEDLGKSPAAKLCARRATRFMDEGRLSDARKALTEALAHDGYDNPELEERIEALDTAIFAMGG